MSNIQRPRRANQQKRKEQLRRKRRRQRNLWTATVGVLLVLVVVLGAMVLNQPPKGSADPAFADRPPADPTDEQTARPTGTQLAAEQTPPPATPTPEPTPEPTPTPAPTPEPTPVKLKYPYYVVVDRGKQVVTVYTLDQYGEYTHVAREMICSTDKYDRKPPDGVYRLDGEHKRWLTTVATPRSYAQYATRIVAKILFHSVPYTSKKANDLDAKAYAALGTNDSIGCIRLLCNDAKWIFDNLPPGTPIRFTTTERDEALLQQLAPPPLISGDWDPTDPDERNPDYNADFVALKPTVTPWLGVTPAPTASWKASKYK